MQDIALNVSKDLNLSQPFRYDELSAQVNTKGYWFP